ncbi:unnamed protein product [Caenorhabditis brenneri]
MNKKNGHDLEATFPDSSSKHQHETHDLNISTSVSSTNKSQQPLKKEQQLPQADDSNFCHEMKTSPQNSISLHVTPASLPSIGNSSRLVLRESSSNEPLDQYKKGGYLTVNIGDVLSSRYTILKKIGWGGYSTVWMAKTKNTDEYVALKITKSAKAHIECSEREIEILEKISMTHSNSNGSNHFVKLLDTFLVYGLNGSHIAMVFRMLGPSLFDIISRSNQRTLHIKLIKRLCLQMLEALGFLHDECGIIHCDFKPENILVEVNERDIQKMDPQSTNYNEGVLSFALNLTGPNCSINFKLADFGISQFANNRNVQSIQTCTYRAPEVFLNAGFGRPADIWSVGCVTYQLITGSKMFVCTRSTDPKFELTQHLSQMIELLGPMRLEDFHNFSHKKSAKECFDSNGTFKSYLPYNQQLFYEKIVGVERLSHQDAYQCTDFILSLMKHNPKKRLTAKKALLHQFVQYTDERSDSPSELQV